MSLGLAPLRALLNDINPHLINFYEWLKKGLVASTPMLNDSDYYYARRSEFNHLLTAGEEYSDRAAILFYYLNRTDYNGLCRFNRAGQFNVPFGRYTRIAYRYDFAEYQELFSSWEFSSCDFRALKLLATDFVYADPPYDVEFRQYSREGFSWGDQVELARWLASHRGPVVLSNQATPRIVQLYRGLGYRIQLLDAPRRISCTGARAPAVEVLATRNL